MYGMWMVIYISNKRIYTYRYTGNDPIERYEKNVYRDTIKSTGIIYSLILYYILL